jgi:hypothetical protein
MLIYFYLLLTMAYLVNVCAYLIFSCLHLSYQSISSSDNVVMNTEVSYKECQFLPFTVLNAKTILLDLILIILLLISSHFILLIGSKPGWFQFGHGGSKHPSKWNIAARTVHVVYLFKYITVLAVYVFLHVRLALYLMTVSK